MTDAIDKTTGKMVSAESLRYLEYVNQDNYQCVCKVKLIPCSHRRDNIPRPYFKFPDGKDHEKDCSEKIRAGLVTIGQKKRVSTSVGFPIPYVNKLVEPASERAVTGGASEIDKLNEKPDNSVITQKKDGIKNRIVTTIKSIVRHFIDFPHDRHLKLSVPGVVQNTYATVFKKIRFEKTITGKKIYYGSPLFAERPTVEPGVVRIKLAEGRWEGRILKEGFVVNLITKDWHQKHIDMVLDMIHYTQVEMKDKGNPGYAFFLGEPRKDDHLVFDVYSHRHIYCLSDKIKYPSWS